MRQAYRIFILFIILFAWNHAYSQNKVGIAEEGTAPFTKIDFKGGDIYVSVDEIEYQWLKLDTLEVADLVDQFQERFDTKWKKRFSEDLVEYLNKLDVYPKQKENFTLKNGAGDVSTIVLAFDENNRDLAKDHFESVYDKDIDINLLFFKEQAIQDLDQLQRLIADKYSYAFLNNVNAKEEIQLIKDELGDEISTYDFALRIGRLLNKFGDGHTRIHNVNFRESGVLPFSVSPFEGKVICSANGKLLNEDYPYLHSINGIGVAELLETSDEYFTPDASPQFMERTRVSKLSRIGEILKINGSTEEKLTIKLESIDGETTSFVQDMDEYKSVREMSPAEREKLYEERDNYMPFEVKHFDEIGYLKIKRMVSLEEDDPNYLPIKKLKKSKGLIIDVRNNGGGVRDILMELAPHLISTEQGFVVGNVARLRTNAPFKKHDLSDRFLYQASSEHFAEAQKSKLVTWTSNFSQSIRLSDSLYSPLYYLYIAGNAKPRFATIPIVVLMNEGCFSATDIFLSTLKEIDGVTLIGTPSGGGSGRSIRYQLNNSLIEVRLSSIVSFQPSGALYDGTGVQPDVVVEKNGIADVLNETDSQLDFALKYLREIKE